VHSYATVLSATAAGIRKYLGSGLIKGIGPVMAKRMVAHFGVGITHVIRMLPPQVSVTTRRASGGDVWSNPISAIGGPGVRVSVSGYGDQSAPREGLWNAA
jgi:hypothetical protein